jgi:hypothetical protein
MWISARFWKQHCSVLTAVPSMTMLGWSRGKALAFCWWPLIPSVYFSACLSLHLWQRKNYINHKLYAAGPSAIILSFVPLQVAWGSASQEWTFPLSVWTEARKVDKLIILGINHNGSNMHRALKLKKENKWNKHVGCSILDFHGSDDCAIFISWRWKQHGPLKCWYRNTTLYGMTT